MSNLTELDAARCFDEGWKAGYQAGSEHPFKVAQTEVKCLRLRLQQAEAIIRLLHDGYDKQPRKDAGQYVRDYKLGDSGPLA